MYFKGDVYWGLGSSVLADIYISYSTIGVCIVMMLFGYFVRTLEYYTSGIRVSPYLLALAFNAFASTMIVCRSSISIMFLFWGYSCIILYLFTRHGQQQVAQIKMKILIHTLAKDAENAAIQYPQHSIWRLFMDYLIPSYCFRYIKLLRTKDYYLNKGTSLSRIIAKYYEIRQHRLGTKLGFYIPKDVFGPGLYIPHSGSVVVNPRAKIGKNCQINNNVVIGQVNGVAPTIGDNVYIGPGAVVSGNITIADNVWIGANAVVTKSVEEKGVLVAGIPAKIVAKKDKNWVEVFKRQS